MTKVRTLILIVAVLGAATLSAQEPTPVAAVADPAPVGAELARPESEAQADTTPLTLLVGRSTIVDVGTPITRVSLTSADVADALVTAPSQLLVHGKLPGSISMFVWDRGGVIRRYEVAVQRDLARLTEQVKQLFPREAISVRGNGRFVVLSGTVSSKDAVEKAVNLAAGFVDKRDEVVSVLQVQENTRTDQVMLRVRFAEVSRTALTDYGLSLFTSPTGVKNTVGRATTQQFPAPGFTDLEWTKRSAEFGAPVASAGGKFTFSDFLNFFILSEKYDLGLAIKALQTRGLFQSLAEPNLVAESGKEASFLAGGEFPIPIAQGVGGNMAITVQFKEFGIRLNFIPVVNGDRVHLKVRPEVSTLDFGNAVVLNGFRIPALSTRRTETELELGDGQTFAIAGLLNNNMNSTLQKIPGIGDIPILGQLFRSKAAQKNRTELVVMITPQILRTNSPGVTTELPRLGEPYLPALPENQSTASPPPAFPR
jgi:pilus assembly protein CpaC